MSFYSWRTEKKNTFDSALLLFCLILFCFLFCHVFIIVLFCSVLSKKRDGWGGGWGWGSVNSSVRRFYLIYTVPLVVLDNRVFRFCLSLTPQHRPKTDDCFCCLIVVGCCYWLVDLVLYAMLFYSNETNKQNKKRKARMGTRSCRCVEGTQSITNIQMHQLVFQITFFNEGLKWKELFNLIFSNDCTTTSHRFRIHVCWHTDLFTF